MSKAKMTVDIYSGVPNPTWDLLDEEFEEFWQKLTSLEESEAVYVTPSGLGYRGVEFTVDGKKHGRAFNGTVCFDSRRFQDPGKKFEKWLLRSGDIEAVL